jgi:hypothetical protein
LPQTPRHFFALTQKNEAKKSQGEFQTLLFCRRAGPTRRAAKTHVAQMPPRQIPHCLARLFGTIAILILMAKRMQVNDSKGFIDIQHHSEPTSRRHHYAKAVTPKNSILCLQGLRITKQETKPNRCSKAFCRNPKPETRQPNNPKSSFEAGILGLCPKPHVIFLP